MDIEYDAERMQERVTLLMQQAHLTYHLFRLESSRKIAFLPRSSKIASKVRSR